MWKVLCNLPRRKNNSITVFHSGFCAEKRILPVRNEFTMHHFLAQNLLSPANFKVARVIHHPISSLESMKRNNSPAIQPMSNLCKKKFIKNVTVGNLVLRKCFWPFCLKILQKNTCDEVEAGLERKKRRKVTHLSIIYWQ